MLFKSANSYSTLFNFELIGYDIQATEGKYVAMALSEDQSMGDDLVFSCMKLKNDQRAKFEVSENIANMNRVLSYRSWAEVQPIAVSSENGKISCKWEIKYEATINNKVYNFLSDYYYILLAKGNLEGNTGELND